MFAGGKPRAQPPEPPRPSIPTLAQPTRRLPPSNRAAMAEQRISSLSWKHGSEALLSPVSTVCAAIVIGGRWRTAASSYPVKLNSPRPAPRSRAEIPHPDKFSVADSGSPAFLAISRSYPVMVRPWLTTSQSQGQLSSMRDAMLCLVYSMFQKGVSVAAVSCDRQFLQPRPDAEHVHVATVRHLVPNYSILLDLPARKQPSHILI